MKGKAKQYCTFLLIIVLAAICAIEIFWGIFQLLGIKQSNHVLFALTGSFNNPGPYGGFLAVCASLLAAFCVNQKELSKNNSVARVAIIFVTFVTVIAISFLPFTQSRASLLAFGLSMLLLCIGSRTIRYLYNKYLNKYTWGVILFFIVLGAIAYTIKKPSADGRFFIDKICIKAICENDILGSGYMSFGEKYSNVQATYFKQIINEKGKDEFDWTAVNEHERMIADCPEYAFNEYLQIGVERGPLIMLLFIFIIAIAIITSFKRRTIWFCGLVALSIFALFSYPFHIISFQIFLLSLFIFCMLDRMPANKTLITIVIIVFSAIPMTLMILDTKKKETQPDLSVWHQIEYWYHNELYDYVAQDGDILLPYNQYNPDFLYMYGYSLNKVGEFEKSDSILELCAKIRCESRIWNLLGDNSLALGDYRKAEERYKHAFYMVPNRMRPLYSIAKLYHKEGDTIRFLKMAETIELFIPKIESNDTRLFRSEIRILKNDYLQEIDNIQNGNQ